MSLSSKMLLIFYTSSTDFQQKRRVSAAILREVFVGRTYCYYLVGQSDSCADFGSLLQQVLFENVQYLASKQADVSIVITLGILFLAEVVTAVPTCSMFTNQFDKKIFKLLHSIKLDLVASFVSFVSTINEVGIYSKYPWSVPINQCMKFSEYIKLTSPRAAYSMEQWNEYRKIIFSFLSLFLVSMVNQKLRHSLLKDKVKLFERAKQTGSLQSG